jgi:hypothetical protein
MPAAVGAFKPLLASRTRLQVSLETLTLAGVGNSVGDQRLPELDPGAFR